MPGLNLTLADAVLKDDYQGPVREQINNDCVLTMQVTKNKGQIIGRRAVVPVHMTRNTGVGSRLEGEVMPEAGAQGYTDQIINLHYHYGRVRFTRQVINRMASDAGSFVRAVQSEMDGLKNDLGRDYNRQLWGNSDGTIATCGTTTATTVVQLAATTPEQILVNLAEGIRVDIGTVASPTAVAANRKITAVDFTNKTVTVDGAAVTTTSSHFLFRQGNGGSGANQRELTGMQTIVNSTGSLFSIDPATYFQWAAIVDGNGGTTRAFSETLFTKTVMRAGNRSGTKDFVIFCEDGVYRSVANLLQAQKRAVNTLTLQGGHKALSVSVGGNEYGIAPDRDAPAGKMYGASVSKLTEFVESDWQWEDTDGAVLHMSMDGTHTFEAYYFKFSEFATTQRNAAFRLDDIEQN